MVYCSKCGSKIDDEAYFCPKCGTKTQAGKAAKANYPTDELRETFYQVGLELEKAFTLAAKETRAAFKKVSEEFKQKPDSSQQAAASSEAMNSCPKCGAKNPSGAIFCSNCGNRLTPVE
ncbi:MAG: zinc-ribbon domain-containing protein [Betaproteobacteria bacterium]